jgi:2-oxoglutarate dehydrogenase E1 component
VAQTDALVVWEAQFGDFSNGAQIIYDQFLAAADEKWDQKSSLTLLLPHGYEGQGPEHSSARLERFLQLCAEGNMTVCYLTTPASYYHVLRRQADPSFTWPLVVMSPKSLLRHPLVHSTAEELANGSFQAVIGSRIDPSAVDRVIVCSGKVYYDLLERLEKDDVRDATAVIRVEQLYPFPADELGSELERYGDAKNVVWLQEEPSNMGAWWYIRPRIDALLSASGRRTTYAGRVASGSPATGSAQVHQGEQNAILDRALRAG